MKNLVCLLMVLAACAPGPRMILEKDYVEPLGVVQSTDSAGHVSLRVSGLAFHSALAVADHRLEQSGDALTLLVTLVPARKGLSGSFDFQIDVPPDVSVVRFGEQQKEIWHR